MSIIGKYRRTKRIIKRPIKNIRTKVGKHYKFSHNKRKKAHYTSSLFN